MLKLLRVDDRLIHGQVAFSWVAATRVNRIVVANDKYATNKMLKMTLSVGKPAGIKMDVLELSAAEEFLKSSEINLEKTMVVVDCIQDALTLCQNLDTIGDICIGGVRDGEAKKLIHSQVFLSETEIKMIEKMVSLGKNVFAQDVPANKSVSSKEIINKFYGR